MTPGRAAPAHTAGQGLNAPAVRTGWKEEETGEEKRGREGRGVCRELCLSADVGRRHTKGRLRAKDKCKSMLWGGKSGVREATALNELRCGRKKSRTREN